MSKKALGLKNAEVAIESKTEEIKDAVVTHTCEHIISSGKNKDTPCGKKVVNNTSVCSKHTKVDKSKTVDSILDYVKALLESGKSPKEVSKLLDSKKVKDEIQTIISPKTRKTKKKKDPKHPKKSLNAYMFFTADNRQKIKDKNPDLTTTEIASKLGELWRNLSDKKKKPFETMAKDDKDRYEEEMKNYTPSSESDSKNDKKNDKNDKKNKTKKRTSTAWELWRKDNKDQIIKDNLNMSPTERQAEIRRVWASLTSEEKDPWQTEADKLKAEKKAESDSESDSEPVKKVPKKKTKKVTKKSESDSESDSSESDVE